MVAMARPWKHPNGTYYFRKWIPNDLQERVGAQIRKVSLQTKDLREAKRRFVAELEKFEQEMECLRRGVSLSPKQIQALAGDWLRDALDEDARQRDQGPPELEIGDWWVDSPYETVLDALEAAEETNDFPRVVHEEVSSVARKHGLHLDPESDEYRQLCEEMFRAKVRFVQTVQRRWMGDWREPKFLQQYAEVSIAALRREGKAKTANVTGNSTRIVSLFEAWRKEKQPEAKTAVEFERAVRRFTELHGDVAPGEIDKAMVRQFKEALLECPAVLSGDLRQATLPELIRVTKDKPDIRRLSPASINKHLAAISALLTFGNENGYCGDDQGWVNPCIGMTVKRRMKQTDRRLGYELEDLQKIFNSPVFTLGERPKGGAGEAAFWLPVLALYTGARVEELGQLLVEDVGCEGGIHYIHINTLHEGKRVKTESSIRKVPLHPEVLRLGFLGYVEECRRKQVTRLFPDLRPDRLGTVTGNWSKWWGRYARQHGIQDSRKVFHSFRHTFKTACRRAGIPQELHDSVTGHSSGGVGERYGERGYPLSVTGPAIAKISYLGLDLVDITGRGPDDSGDPQPPMKAA
ncbi:MAG: site-specific integrase [Ectothiorhodospiraceae bacterium]|nr:site-specific integrase [Ectothiorhodospiraceae bacterium]